MQTTQRIASVPSHSSSSPNGKRLPLGGGSAALRRLSCCTLLRSRSARQTPLPRASPRRRPRRAGLVVGARSLSLATVTDDAWQWSRLEHGVGMLRPLFRKVTRKEARSSFALRREKHCLYRVSAEEVLLLQLQHSKYCKQNHVPMAHGCASVFHTSAYSENPKAQSTTRSVHPHPALSGR